MRSLVSLALILGAGVVLGIGATFAYSLLTAEEAPTPLVGAEETNRIPDVEDPSSSDSVPTPLPDPEEDGTDPNEVTTISAETLDLQKMIETLEITAAEMTVEEIEQHLAVLIKEGGSIRPIYEVWLRELVRRKDEDAVGVLLQAMENPECDFPQRASVFSTLLLTLEDKRIYPAARRVLTKNVASGRDSWYDTSGYLALIAEKGGNEGAEMLISSILTKDPLAFVAAGEVWRITDPTQAGPLLGWVEQGFHTTTYPVVDGLVRWKDQRVVDMLMTIATTARTDPRTKQAIFRAVLVHLPEGKADELLSYYWKSDVTEDRNAFLGALGYLDDSSAQNELQLRRMMIPVLANALADDTREVWLRAVNVLEQKNFFHTIEIQTALSQLFPRISSNEDKKRVRTLQDQVRDHIRG